LDLVPVVPLRGMKVYPDQNCKWPSPYKEIADCLGGCSFHKFDRDGNPLYIERAGFHDTQNLSRVGNLQDVLDFHVRSNEFLYQKIMPGLNSLPEHRDVDCMSVIFDLKGLGFHQFQIPALKMLKGIGELDHDYYPERLATLFIVNAPSIFGKFWNFVKGSFDKKVIEKTRIFPEGEDHTPALLEKIPPENLPTFLGGTCECQCEGGCVPCFLPALPDHLEFKTGIEVKPREIHKIELELETAKSVVSVRWKSKHEISYGVHHRSASSPDLTVIHESKLYESHKNPAEHTFVVTTPGTFELVFSNKHHLLRSNQIFYTIDYQESETK